MSLLLAPNSWPGFQGFYSLYVDDDLSDFVYIINDVVYDAETLDDVEVYGNRIEPTSPQEIIDRYELVPPLNIDPNGSQLLAIQMNDEPIDLIYQQQSNGRFIELTNWGEDEDNFQHNINDVKILNVPLPNGIDVNLDSNFQGIQLTELDTDIVDELLRKRDRRETISLNGILEFLNSGTSSIQEEPLFKSSYETLLRRLYNLPIINNEGLNFISFQEISQMLSQNQIERYIIDPLLQPWTSESNKILTMYGRNGVTYLVSAQYDQINNQILPPL